MTGSSHGHVCYMLGALLTSGSQEVKVFIQGV